MTAAIDARSTPGDDSSRLPGRQPAERGGRREEPSNEALVAPVARRDRTARAVANEAGEALRAALASLSDPLREAFVLVRLCGASYESAAEALEVPLGTIKSRMAGAEAALRERLRDEPLRDEPLRDEPLRD